MASTDVSNTTPTEMPEAATIDMKLEVVTLPVSDVDRAKRFYQSLGWRMDADITVGDAFRVVQLTPPPLGRVAAPGDQDAAPWPGVGGLTMDIAARAGLLRETAEHHDPYEKTHAPHNWWDWYAAYMDAREQERTPDEASEAAGRYMTEVLHIAAL